MPMTEAGQNAAAEGFTDAFPYAALFDGDPLGAGLELTGGSPAYARKLLDFSPAASGGVDSAAATATFDIPSGATIAYVAMFDSLTDGNMGGYGELPAPEGPYVAQGTYDLTAADIQVV